MAPAPGTAYRCPRPDCGQTFRSETAEPGRLVDCATCGRPMNARPLAMERELEERERSTSGSAGLEGMARLPIVALVDNVRSLWNVGSMFRTADACGLRRVVLCGITGCPPRPEIAKTALGGDEVVAWSYRAAALAALAAVRSEGFVPVAIETGAGAEPVSSFSWPDRPCLVVGNEVRGVSPEVLDACERRVEIPMRGVKDTLNVAVAFGIATFFAAEAVARREN